MLASVSVIIVSRKDPEEIATLDSIDIFPTCQIVISRKSGLGFARNEGARKSRFVDFFVFLDDDLKLDTALWRSYLSRIKRKEFAMLEVNGRCSSRVVGIHKEDFWSIGGFDERIRYTAEDIDFFLRAKRKGLRYRPIPERFARHIPHRERWRDRVTSFHQHFEHGYLIVRHGFDYIDFWEGFRAFLLTMIKKPRTHFPTFFGFFYYLVRMWIYESKTTFDYLGAANPFARSKEL